MPNTQQRVVARFLATNDKTAASDPKKLLKDGWNNATLKRVKKDWDDLGKGVAEAQRQFNAAGGALPTADMNNIVKRFIYEPLKDLGETATDWAKTLKTAKAENVTAGSKKLDEKDIADLNSMTGRNDHTTAYIKGSELIGATHTAKKLELVAKLLKLEGYLPADLSKYQYRLYQEMLKEAKRTLSPEGYDEFYSCF